MAILPDPGKFVSGELQGANAMKPQAAPQAVISNPQPVGAGVVSGAAAAGGEGMGQFLDTMQKAAERQQSYTDGADRLSKISEFRTQAMNETNRMMAEDDISAPAVTQRYGQFMRDLTNNVLSSHQGSQESRMKLQSFIQNEQLDYVGKVAAAGADALQKKQGAILDQELNGLSMKVYAEPTSWRQNYDKFTQIMSATNIAGPAAEARMNAAHGALAATAAEGSIIRGDIDAAINIMGDPTVAKNIPGQLREKLFGMVSEVQKTKADPRRNFMETPGGLLDLRTNRFVPGTQKKSELQMNVEAAFPGEPDKQRAAIASTFEDKTQTPDIKNALFEANGNLTKAREVMSAINKRKGGPLVQFATEAEQSKANVEIDKKAVEQFTAAADSARSRRPVIDMSESAFNSPSATQTGALGEWRTTAARYVEAFLPDDLEGKKKILEQIGVASPENAELIKNLSSQLLATILPDRGQTLKNQYRVSADQVTNLLTTSEGNKTLLAIMRAKDDDAMETGKRAREDFRKNGSLAEFEKWQNEQKPFFERHPELVDKIKNPEGSTPLRIGAAVIGAGEAARGAINGVEPIDMTQDQVNSAPLVSEAEFSRMKLDPANAGKLMRVKRKDGTIAPFYIEAPK
jgi:hypothetical protein